MKLLITAKLTAALLLPVLLAACASPIALKPDYSPADPHIVINTNEPNGAIYQVSNNRFFFEDIRARRVGDVINVILQERTDATKSASTSANKGTNIELPNPTLFGGQITGRGRALLANEVGASTDFNGTADSSQSNRLTGSVAVVVDEVLSNGNLRIRGEKRLTLNQGSELVRVSGLVRSVDITPDNTILSHQIADAEISYGGRGVLADSNRAGWLTRLFTSILWPF